ncbi:MAG: YigZ family protein [Oscillospiraceae bacterium]
MRRIHDRILHPHGPQRDGVRGKTVPLHRPCLARGGEEEARARIEEMKKRYYDARHNCWCYLIQDGPVRYSDDGEPQGTAGQPMLNVFQREGVVNVVCVVTRYFGGILLGAGGLVRRLCPERQGRPGRRRDLRGAPVDRGATALLLCPV